MERVRSIQLCLVAIILATGFAGCEPKGASVLEKYESWPMGISIGVQTSAEKMQEAKDVGFDYVEVGFSRKRDTTAEERIADIERFRADAKRIGLKVWSIHLPYGKEWNPSEVDESARLKNVADVGRLIEMAAPLKPQKFVLHASWEPIADSMRETHFAAAIQSFNALNHYAVKLGAQLLVEDLPRTCIGNTTAEIQRLLAAIDPSVGVCFDTNHLLQDTSADFARTMGPEIASLHISDYDMINERHWLMGEGVVEWEELISALAAADYDGVFMFEVSGYDSYREIADNWTYMRDRLARYENKE